MIEKLHIILFGIAFLVIFCLINLYPKSSFYSAKLFEYKESKKIIYIIVILNILYCIIPMGFSPVLNGEIYNHRNQYEKLTNAFLNGHIYLDDEVDESLLNMDNPYNPIERSKNKVEFLFDHSYYNGKYYVYFGIAPVILLFLPYKIITGKSLITYHATQIFSSIFIIMIFYIFYLLSKKFFKNIPLKIYLFLSSAISSMSLWCAVSVPTLYCTAITSGLVMISLGIFFWMKALWDSNSQKQSLIFATLGSFFGAATFACRPPIALANISILFFMISYLKDKEILKKKKIIQIIIIITPYIIIGTLLMIYNYLRFNNILEFGQHYQLTVSDLTNTKKISLIEFIKKLHVYLFNFSNIENFIYNGTFITFPILFYLFSIIFNKSLRKSILSSKINSFLISLTISCFAILSIDIIASPDILPRYRMDTYWIFGIIIFIIIGFSYEIKKHKKIFSFLVCLFSFLTMISAIILFLFPNESNFTSYYYFQLKDLFNFLH